VLFSRLCFFFNLGVGQGNFRLGACMFFFLVFLFRVPSWKNLSVSLAVGTGTGAFWFLYFFFVHTNWALGVIFSHHNWYKRCFLSILAHCLLLRLGLDTENIIIRALFSRWLWFRVRCFLRPRKNRFLSLGRFILLNLGLGLDWLVVHACYHFVVDHGL